MKRWCVAGKWGAAGPEATSVWCVQARLRLDPGASMICTGATGREAPEPAS